VVGSQVFMLQSAQYSIQTRCKQAACFVSHGTKWWFPCSKFFSK